MYSIGHASTTTKNATSLNESTAYNGGALPKKSEIVFFGGPPWKVAGDWTPAALLLASAAGGGAAESALGAGWATLR